jgi:HEAT repeats
MTTAELRKKLSVIEPTEAMYAGIAVADLPALEQLLADHEDWVAARAVFALSRVGGSAATAVLTKAAQDPRAPVRVAVAVAIGQRPIVLPDNILLNLLRDKDIGVRKFAPQAVKPENGAEPRELLTRVATDDAVPAVREKAAEALRKFR